MGWLNDKFERANVRRFQRAITDAKESLAQMPAQRREQSARDFQDAADRALRDSRYRHPGGRRQREITGIINGSAAGVCKNIYGGHMCTQPRDHDGPHTCGEPSDGQPCGGKWSDEQGHYPGT